MNKIMKALALTLGIGGCVLVNNHIKTHTQTEKLEEIMEATHCIKNEVDIQCNFGNKTITGYGSAFAYKNLDDNTYLTTAEHVVDIPDYIMAINPSCVVTDHRISIVDDIEDTNEEDDIKLEKVLTGETGDFAILKAEEEMFVPQYTITNKQPQVGDTMYSFGYPRAYVKVCTEGAVSNPDFQMDDGGNYFLLNATVISGMSGGAVFSADEKGNMYFRGVNVASLRDSSGMRDISFINYITDHLEELKIKK